MSQTSHAPVKAAPAMKPSAKPSLTRARGALLQRKCGCGASPTGKCNDCNEEGKTLQRSAANQQAAPASAPGIVHDVLNSPGRPLDTPTRAFMEPRFGRDFSGVRVHDDSRAAESARAVDARAYTVGQHIAFDRGEYQPHTPAGRNLLAHELAHTVQQADAAPSMQSKLAVGDADTVSEREADAAAARVVSGGSAAIYQRVGAGGLHRQVKAGAGPGPAKPPGQPTMKLPCGDILLAPEGPRVNGNRAHQVIEDDFNSQVGPNAVKFWIPGATSGVLRSGVCEMDDDGGRRNFGNEDDFLAEDEQGEKVPGTGGGVKEGGKRAFGKPDLMYRNKKTVELAEIKIGVTDCLVLAEQQVQRYVDQANEPDLKARWKRKGVSKFILMPTSRYTPKTPIQVDGTPVAVAWCAPGVIVYKPIDPNSPAWGSIAAASDTEPYTLQAGTNTVVIRVPKRTGKPKAEKVPLSGSEIPENVSAAETLVPGVILLTLNRKAKGADTIEACLATQTCGKKTGKGGLPIKVAAGKGKLVFNIEKTTGKLSLAKTPTFPFHYDFLSEGVINKLNYDAEKGVSGEGSIKPSLSLLRGLKLGIAFTPDSFAVTAGLDDATLKKALKPIPFAKLTKAQLSLELFPEFVPKGELEMEIVAGKRKILDAAVMIKPGPTGGLYAEGKLNAYIPGVDKAEGNVVYDAGQWSAYAELQSTQMNLPYVTGGTVKAGFTEKGPFGSGTVDLEIPGGHKARVGLNYRNQTWFFSGKGEFNVKRIGASVDLIIDYFDGKVLRGQGTVKNFNFKGLKGDLTVNYEGKVGANRPRIWGTGTFDIQKGKVTGKLTVNLLETGKFSGDGSISYEIKPGLVAAAGIIIDKDEKVTVVGSLSFPPYKLFDKHPKTPRRINIFSFSKDIPVPFLSIGPVGLQARVGAGLFVEYGIGPGMIKDGYIKAQVNPLEEDPDPQFEVGGKISVPMFFGVTGYISGGLVLDVGIAEAGGKVVVSATAMLGGEAGATLMAKYAKGEFRAEVDVSLILELFLKLCVSAHVWAQAGVWRFKVRTSKSWQLLDFTYRPGLKLGIEGLKKPIAYSSKTGFELPSFEDINWVKPSLNAADALKTGVDAAGGEKNGPKPPPCPVIDEE